MTSASTTRPLSPFSPAFVPASEATIDAFRSASPALFVSPPNKASSPVAKSQDRPAAWPVALLAPTRPKFEWTTAMADCEWTCGFCTTLEKVLQALQQDPEVERRCYFREVNPKDGEAFARFVAGHNCPLQPNISPLSILHESLWRWAGMSSENVPQLLLDLSARPAERAEASFERLLVEEASAVPAWITTRRRCRCLSRLQLGKEVRPVSPVSPEDGLFFWDSRDWVARLTCERGEVFGWSREEVGALSAVGQKWRLISPGKAEPIPLLSLADAKHLSELFAKTRPRGIASLLPNFW